MLFSSISVVQASGECLRGILATRKGQEALSSLEDDRKDCCLYLEPFRQQRKKKVSLLYRLCALFTFMFLVLFRLPSHYKLYPDLCPSQVWLTLLTFGSHQRVCLIGCGSHN